MIEKALEFHRSGDEKRNYLVFHEKQILWNYKMRNV